MEVPKSILNASKAIYLSVILEIINLILSYIFWGIPHFSDPTYLMIVILSTLLLVFLAYDISREKNWARIVFIITSGLGLIIGFQAFIEIFKSSIIIGVNSILQVILQIIAIALLVSPSSTAWYKKKLNNTYIAPTLSLFFLLPLLLLNIAGT